MYVYTIIYQETAENTSLQSLFDRLALSILILFYLSVFFI